MSRAIVTFGVGPHEHLLEIAMPSFERFADEHGYDIVIPEPIPECGRPPSWWKVPAVADALDDYDEVLWIDSDVVIVDPSEDLPVPRQAWQAVVAHHTSDGEVPNLGVWFVRRPMRLLLEQLWGMTEYRDHPWWEQAGMVTMLGYGGWPLRLQQPSGLYRHTSFLNPVWNVHVNDGDRPKKGRFMHATMLPDREQAMVEWAAT